MDIERRYTVFASGDCQAITWEASRGSEDMYKPDPELWQLAWTIYNLLTKLNPRIYAITIVEHNNGKIRIICHDSHMQQMSRIIAGY